LYYYAEHGQIVTNKPAQITVSSGQKVKENLTVAYMIPAAEGTVRLTGAPKKFNSEAYMGVQGCPAGKAGCKGGTEAYEGIAPDQPYSIDLSPGSWTIYVYYRPNDNSHLFTGQPVTITVTAGQTIHPDLTIAYQGL
jgi:archaellum component FlaF (FlaF/FlaG flagellin family)